MMIQDNPRIAAMAPRGDEMESSSGERGPVQEDLDHLMERYRPLLLRIAARRLDPRLRGRLDVSDVVQETYLEATRRLRGGGRESGMPLFTWLRLMVDQQLAVERRRHLGTRARDVRREALATEGDAVHEGIPGNAHGPATGAVKLETRGMVLEALDRLDPKDREILLLRHFEHLSHADIARRLGMAEPAVRKRYIRAAGKLRRRAEHLPEFLD